MTTNPQRPDIARDLIDRAKRSRQYHSRLARGLLSRTEIDMGRHNEHVNAQVLRRIVSEHGWPGRSLVGEEGAKSAWQIALHADHLADFQRLALRLMATTVERGEATIQQWAHLHDRCSINAGAAQTYGTQYRSGPDGVEPLPVREPKHLNARRASVGLQSFATAHEALRRRHTREPESGPPDDTEHRAAALPVKTAARGPPPGALQRKPLPRSESPPVGCWSRAGPTLEASLSDKVENRPRDRCRSKQSCGVNPDRNSLRCPQGGLRC
ncbi:hypothetical protein M2271_002209 [Streptomyces sp. LBL]|nr:hypothetical protein [Streptomyces sp. LBL]